MNTKQEVKTSKLKGKKPEKVEKRLKMFVFGSAGVGKTLSSLQFPNSYIIDTEKGTDFYSESIKKSNSAVFQTNDSEEIQNEIKTLLTENHEYRTLIIDPITQVYNSIQSKWARIFEKYAKDEQAKEVQDFGMRFWGKVKGDYKAIQRLILRLDMNVIVTSHQKDVYGQNFSKLGVTFDSMKGDDYFYDLIFQIEKRGNKRIATTIKERAEAGLNKFPDEFEWSYDNFCKFYGKDIIEKKAKVVDMATEDQISKIEKLIEFVKVDDKTINVWMEKADADRWEDFTFEKLQACINHLESKLKEIK